MTTEASVVESVRRRVADYASPQRYELSYYQDAISFALQKLSYDFDVTYSIVADVPNKHVFLLVKLAAIEMCYIRASEGAEGEGTEGEETRFTNIAVPDLSVSDGGVGESRGPAYWLTLAKRLQSEYDGEVGSSAGQNTGGEVQVTFARRISMRHGGYQKRRLDPGLDALTVAGSVSGGIVTLTWSKLQTEGFSYYEVVRVLDVDDFGSDSEDILSQESDIHIEEYIDETVTSGTWYYRVRTVNPNGISTDSNTVTVIV